MYLVLVQSSHRFTTRNICIRLAARINRAYGNFLREKKFASRKNGRSSRHEYQIFFPILAATQKTKSGWKSMNSVRFFSSAAVLNERIYVAGGTDLKTVTEMNSVEMYDPKSDEWTEVASTNKAWRLFTLIESEGFLIAMGDDPVIERYDPRQNRWTMVRENNSHFDIIHFAFQIG